MMGDICIAESGKAGRNHLVAIWHSPGADASNPLSTCCLTGLCLHSRQIATSISSLYPCAQSHHRAFLYHASEFRILDRNVLRM